MMDSASSFQARATEEGRAAQDNAGRVLAGCGFTNIRRNRRRKELGVLINFIATDKSGRDWYFDVSGAFTTPNPGLMRTDTMWKTLGRAGLLTLNGIQPIVLLTTNLPMRGSVGDLALRATHGRMFFDALEMTPANSKLRLRAYASGNTGTRPLPGFWSSDELYGSRLHIPNPLNASLSVPLQETGDPFGYLASDPRVRRMPHRLKVFLPSQTSGGTSILDSRRQEVLRETQHDLAALCGGFTSNPVRGYWVNPIGGIARDCG